MIYVILFALFFSCEEPGLDIIQPAKGDNEETEIMNSGKYLALGDSYTIGESVEEAYRWPNLLRDSLMVRGIDFEKPQIIARTGWRTDQLLNQAISEAPDRDYAMVSLLIGVNNQYQGRSVESYRPEFEELLKFSIKKAGGDTSRVFVVSIPDYGCTPFGERNAEEIGKAIDEFNAANREITESYGIEYFYITDISRQGKDNPDLVASDGLHPSGEQYAAWVSRMMKNEVFFGAFGN